MENRLDQGHLHPELGSQEPRLTCLGRESNPGGERYSKELFKQRVNRFLEHPNKSPRQCRYLKSSGEQLYRYRI